KAYVYEAALRSGKITLASNLLDQPYNYPDTNKPVLDWDNSYDGNITAAKALLLSRNVPAVKVGQMEGMSNVNDLARSMGVTGNLVDVPSGAIGTSEISVMANVQGYQVFADQGKKVPLMAVTKVVGDTGQTIYTAQPGTQDGQSQVLTPAESWLITSVLHGYPGYWGLGWRNSMAGKSGTTGGASINQHPDAWMMAYNPKIVIGSWAANTGPGDQARYTAAFGTSVGSTITASFVNSLPAAYRGWYSSAPSGVVQGSGCPGQQSGSLWFLAGSENEIDCPTPTPQPTESPTPEPIQLPGGLFPFSPPTPELTPTPTPDQNTPP
ncbi:MAG: penicillin-binding transpeptidase domain-containing protein, partial [Candidatus Dormibacteraceae bacterium]